MDKVTSISVDGGGGGLLRIWSCYQKVLIRIYWQDRMDCSPSYSLRQGLSPNPEHANKTPGIACLCLVSSGITGSSHVLGLWGSKLWFP